MRRKHRPYIPPANPHLSQRIGDVVTLPVVSSDQAWAHGLGLPPQLHEVGASGKTRFMASGRIYDYAADGGHSQIAVKYTARFEGARTLFIAAGPYEPGWVRPGDDSIDRAIVDQSQLVVETLALSDKSAIKPGLCGYVTLLLLAKHGLYPPVDDLAADIPVSLVGQLKAYQGTPPQAVSIDIFRRNGIQAPLAVVKHAEPAPMLLSFSACTVGDVSDIESAVQHLTRPEFPAVLPDATIASTRPPENVAVISEMSRMVGAIVLAQHQSR